MNFICLVFFNFLIDRYLEPFNEVDAGKFAVLNCLAACCEVHSSKELTDKSACGGGVIVFGGHKSFTVSNESNDGIVGLQDFAVLEVDNELIGCFAVAVSGGCVFNADKGAEGDKECVFCKPFHVRDF